MTPVFVQIKFFLNTIAIGFIIGIVFDFYRALRFLARPQKWTTDLCDLIISILLIGITFLLLIFSNWGEVRLYVFWGIGLGLGIYLKYGSAKIRSLWLYWLRFLVKSIKIVATIFFWPFIIIKKVLAWPLGLISMLLYKTSNLVKHILRIPARKLRSLWISWRKPKEP